MTRKMGKKTKRPVTVMLDAKAIGQRIREARKRRLWQIADLARVVGVARATCAAWECGSRIPERDALCRLAKTLQRKTDYLLFGGRDYWWRRKDATQGIPADE